MSFVGQTFQSAILKRPYDRLEETVPQLTNSSEETLSSVGAVREPPKIRALLEAPLHKNGSTPGVFETGSKACPTHSLDPGRCPLNHLRGTRRLCAEIFFLRPYGSPPEIQPVCVPARLDSDVPFCLAVSVVFTRICQ